MGEVGILVLFAVGFVVGKNWTKIKGFVQSSVSEVKKKKK